MFAHMYFPRRNTHINIHVYRAYGNRYAGVFRVRQELRFFLRTENVALTKKARVKFQRETHLEVQCRANEPWEKYFHTEYTKP